MNLAITGTGTTAEATLHWCGAYFGATNTPTPNTDILWACHDVDGDIYSGVDDAMAKICSDAAHLSDGKLVIVSSQLPPGRTRFLANQMPHLAFAHIPENIRRASNIDDFRSQSRIVVGLRDPSFKPVIAELLELFTNHLIFTDLTTAEMAKCALNAWLAMNIAFANELGDICQKHGSNEGVVYEALMSDHRVGLNAPLLAGKPYGHLDREVNYLRKLAPDATLIDAIFSSNCSRKLAL